MKILGAPLSLALLWISAGSCNSHQGGAAPPTDGPRLSAEAGAMLALDAALTADRPASLSPDLNAERRSADEDQGRDGQGPDGGRYTQGVYSCCAKGEGTACCEGKGQGACFAYGGIYKDCVSAGGEIEGKVICGLCCPGLTRGSHDIEMKGACVRVGPVSIGVCIACGDGKCGSGENRCNCPADCPP